MDLITGLPTHKGKNAILTIVDQGCSRAAIFLPCNTTITGPGIAQLYLDNVYRWFRLPSKIISDRDPRFTSHFSKALTNKLQTQRNVSTAFHPQTDGLSERKKPMGGAIPPSSNLSIPRRLDPLADHSHCGTQ